LSKATHFYVFDILTLAKLCTGNDQFRDEKVRSTTLNLHVSKGFQNKGISFPTHNTSTSSSLYFQQVMHRKLNLLAETENSEYQ